MGYQAKPATEKKTNNNNLKPKNCVSRLMFSFGTKGNLKKQDLVFETIKRQYVIRSYERHGVNVFFFPTQALLSLVNLRRIRISTLYSFSLFAILSSTYQETGLFAQQQTVSDNEAYKDLVNRLALIFRLHQVASGGRSRYQCHVIGLGQNKCSFSGN